MHVNLAPAAPDGHRLGPAERLARAKFTQPVRFYAYGWSLLLLLVLAVTAGITGGWMQAALGAVVLLLTVPGVEAAARSALAPADVITQLVAARDRSTLAAAAGYPGDPVDPS